ncbi:SpoIIE family protein phosphatase [Streptomyces bluensis]|uniref:ATP-binding SpoIIE family protein phosphatase n=1 Tax=Streptomyces bluensis TaxID=33897 RepID=UPI00369557F7
MQPPDAAVAAVDAHGQVTAWSPGARQLLGYEPSEVLGRPASLLLAAAPSEAALRRAVASQSWSGRVALRHQDGHRLDAELRAWSAPTTGGQPQWFLVHSPGNRPPRGQWRAAGAYDDGQLLEWAFARSPLTMAVYDVDGRILRMNAATCRLLGIDEHQVLGRVVEDLCGDAQERGAPSAPAFCEPLTETMRSVARTGRQARYEVAAPTTAAGTGKVSWWAVTMSPVTDPDGRIHGVFTAGCDITGQYEARQRLALLNEANARIGATLDVSRTADELADMAVPRLADFVSVDLLDSVLHGGDPFPGPVVGTVTLRRVAHRSATEGAPEAAVKLGAVDNYPDYSPPARSLASGLPVLSTKGEDDFDRWIQSRPARASRVRDYGFHSVLSTPVRARGTTLGVAVFARRRPEPFDPDDLLLAGEMVARAAVCVDNARRYTRERVTALSLQRSLLPRQLPRQPAVEVATRYLPGSTQAGFGGDWFDVIPLSGARVALVVGDVIGHGLQATAAMGRLRIAVRTLADVDLAPDELLTQLDDLVIRLAAESSSAAADGRDQRDQAGDRTEGTDRAERTERPESPEPLRRPEPPESPEVLQALEALEAPEDEETAGDMAATCLYAVYDPVTRHCTIARAGGPVPALVRRDGTVELLDVPTGPRLGVGGLPFEATELELPEGSLVVLFTDGLVNARPGNLDTLCRILSHHPGRDLEETCDTVLERLLPGLPADDVALLIARTRALDTDRVATWDLDKEPSVVAGARKVTSDQLARWGLDDLTFTTELVVSELVTNAIRHAEAPIRLRLIQDQCLICEVSDGSNSAPHPRRARTFDEGGRGLMLVGQLADRWGTRQTPTGKIVWTEQCLPAA